MGKKKITNPPITCIETEIWEPNPDKSGYLRLVRHKTFKEVFEETKQFLIERDIWDNLDYFNLQNDKECESNPFPAWRMICCYAVVGSSEGYYVHVDIIDIDGKRIPLFIGKILSSMEYALYISNMLTKVFWDKL